MHITVLWFWSQHFTVYNQGCALKDVFSGCTKPKLTRNPLPSLRREVLRDFGVVAVGYPCGQGPAEGFDVSASGWSELKSTPLDTEWVHFSSCICNITKR